MPDFGCRPSVDGCRPSDGWPPGGQAKVKQPRNLTAYDGTAAADQGPQLQALDCSGTPRSPPRDDLQAGGRRFDPGWLHGRKDLETSGFWTASCRRSHAPATPDGLFDGLNLIVEHSNRGADASPRGQDRLRRLFRGLQARVATPGWAALRSASCDALRAPSRQSVAGAPSTREGALQSIAVGAY